MVSPPIVRTPAYTGRNPRRNCFHSSICAHSSFAMDRSFPHNNTPQPQAQTRSSRSCPLFSPVSNSSTAASNRNSRTSAYPRTAVQSFVRSAEEKEPFQHGQRIFRHLGKFRCALFQIRLPEFCPGESRLHPGMKCSCASASGASRHRLVHTRRNARIFRYLILQCSRSFLRSLPAAATLPPEPDSARPARRTSRWMPPRLPRRGCGCNRSGSAKRRSGSGRRTPRSRTARPAGLHPEAPSGPLIQPGAGSQAPLPARAEAHTPGCLSAGRCKASRTTVRGRTGPPQGS